MESNLSSVSDEDFTANFGHRHGLGLDASHKDFFDFRRSVFRSYCACYNFVCMFKSQSKFYNRPRQNVCIFSSKYFDGNYSNQLPKIKQYWDSDLFLGNAGFKTTMPFWPFGWAHSCKKSRSRKFIKPAVISFYNKFMNGVDVNDQYRSYYPVGAQFKKWWKYLAWFFVNISIVHSFILSSGPTSHKKDVPVGRNVKGHSLVKSSERKRACVMCAKAGRKLWSGRTL